MKAKKVDLDLLRTRWMEGRAGQDIARELGCSAGHVSNTAKKIGLPRRNDKPVTKKLPGLAELVRAGKPVEWIADHFDVAESTVYRRMKQQGLRRPDWVALPEKPPAPVRAEPQIDVSTLTGQLLVTKGRWSKLAEIADRHGWTCAQVQQRYHAAVRGMA
jgi:DNA-binding CsgD family transcriptional regulator